ncbi:MAG: tRNA-dihydrouridine synthase [Clostridia bacterium]|nr:tRNA-dihydrouridine synthase [Clostridia bacterium]
MLKTNIMGFEIKNPVVIGSGPWCRGENLKPALTCGAGAIVTETITGDSYPDVSPRYDYDSGSRGLQNIRLYSSIDLETWIHDLKEIEKNDRYGSDTKLIASVMGSSSSELAYIAKKVEKTGVDGIELGLACPMGEGVSVIASDAEKVYRYVSETVDAVKIPVSVKLSANSYNLPEVVKACNKAGAAGISAIDTVRGILSIDIETGRPGLATYGGYSGAPIKPIGLAIVAGIAQTSSLPLIGLGGIENGSNLLEYIMAGASAGGVSSAVLLRGYDVVGEILDYLEKWFESHNITDISMIKGRALDRLKSFEEIKVEKKVASLKEVCAGRDCDICSRGCLDTAIFNDNGIRVDSAKCSGCGVCINICPDKKFELVWK